MRFDSRHADRLTAVVLFAVGITMLWAGYTMDRLEFRQIHPASIPGLVPMMLGGAMAVCATLLFLSAREEGRAPAAAGSWRDLGLAALWSIVFALGLVGRVSFPLATAIYIGGFVLLFDRGGSLVRRVLLAVLFGTVSAGVISALFRYAFLVRLP